MRENNSQPEILTLAEASRFIRVSEKTLGEMARTRRIPSQKVGREWRFLRTALRAWLAGDVENAVTSGIGVGAGPDADGIHEPHVQYELFPSEGFRDTAFVENRDRTVHRWVPWIAGYSASFVADALERRNRGSKMRVLDPFAGVGTTLIEALKHGDDAFGFEINPYAALACRVKTECHRYDVARLDAAIGQFEEYGEDETWLNDRPDSTFPSGFRTRVPFFSSAVERQVLACMDFFMKRTSGRIRDLFRVALGSVMVSFSNYSYEPSLGTRSGAGKPNIEHADVFGIVHRKLTDMRADIVSFQDSIRRYDPVPRATLYPSSYFDSFQEIDAKSIDVLVTSPPYLNNYHYIRNTRPHLFWLGMVQQASDLKEVEQRSFGQFWQSVRSGPEIELRPKLNHLTEKLKELRELNVEKGPYGGPGWANYAAVYFNDCQRFCLVTHSRMRPGGTVIVVIGNNILQGIEFKTDELFAEIAEQEGFEIVDLHRVRNKRTGNSIVNSSVRVGMVTQRTLLYESAVELRVP